MSTHSIHEAADLLGVRPRRVRRAIREGELEAEADGSDYLIERTELEEFAEEHGIELEDAEFSDDGIDNRIDAAMEEHRPSWEAGFRSGYAAGAQEAEDE